mmetsp:Transcript_72311/g.182353  ORF Transcript_72311/g.182353 Transcript_72311/m.182353 type:complete len:352 (-) Transcript_72311:182-1237(-)
MIRLANAKRKAGNSEAQRTSCTHVSCKYGVSASPFCNNLANPSGECSKMSSLPFVSSETTFRAHTAASRTFESLASRYAVMTFTPSAFSVSLRPRGSLPQCHSTRKACRKVSTESACEAPGSKPSFGILAKKPTMRSNKWTPKRSFMPPSAYMVTAAKVCSKYKRQSDKCSELGRSGSVAQRYCAVLRMVPWSTACWHPSLKMVTACKARAAFILTSSSLQLRSNFASLGSVGPVLTAPVSLRAMLVLPTGIKERPPMRSAKLPITRAASLRTGMLSCVSRCVAAATTSEAIAWHLFSWFELKSQIVRKASQSLSGAMPGVFNCSTRRGKRRSPCAIVTSSCFKWPRMSSK